MHFPIFLFATFGFSSFQTSKPPHLLSEVPLGQVAQWQWTQSKWTTDGDRLLRVERDKLEKIFADDKEHTDLVGQLRQASRRSPSDRVKLFLSGYAAYLRARNEPISSTDRLMVQTLAETKPPYSYEFLRMWFLAVGKLYGDSNDYLISLGERLAKSDPKDIAVIHELSRSMLVSIPEARKKAFDYANRLRVIDPSRPEAYSDVAAVYYDIWILSDAKDTEAGHQVIHWLNEYLKREKRPIKADNVAFVKATIGRINDAIVKEENAHTKKP